MLLYYQLPQTMEQLPPSIIVLSRKNSFLIPSLINSYSHGRVGSLGDTTNALTDALTNRKPIGLLCREKQINSTDSYFEIFLKLLPSAYSMTYGSLFSTKVLNKKWEFNKNNCYNTNFTGTFVVLSSSKRVIY